MDIKSVANQVAKRCDSRDLFEIAQSLGFIVISASLLEMRGMRQYLNRRVIIYINSDLDEHQQRLVCAHELGHHFLHRGLNRMFMDRYTHMPTGRYENEASRFAVDLLFDDFDLKDLLGCSPEAVAEYLGVNCELAEYRMKSVNPRLF